MTINKKEQLKFLIKELVDAEIADSWKGGGDPAYIPAIEAELTTCRLQLELFIDKYVRFR